MPKLGFLLSLAAVALIAACAHRVTPAPAPVVVVQQPPPTVVPAPAAPAVVVPQPIVLHPGIGRVESLSAVPASPGTGRASPATMRRLGIRMNDGTVQYVDAEASNVAIGDRVELTADGYMRPL